MDIREFLEKFVEGYLFEDLRSMGAISAGAGRTSGAVVYPMIGSALAGVELLGNLVQVARSFDRQEGAAAFEHFWAEYLYTDSRRRQLARPVYQLVRHGLAHVFLAKPGILATKDNVAARHLCKASDGSLVIDALVLNADLRRAYDEGVKPLLEIARTDIPNCRTMQTRLDEMICEYTKQSGAYAQVLAAVDPAPTRNATPIAVNSPTVNPTTSSTGLPRTSSGSFGPKARP
jgi:hypothetical protein